MNGVRAWFARLLNRDQWRWLEPIRANPQTYQVYRVAVAIAGFVIVAIGLVLVPLPGPGWLIVFLGVSLWASEFRWARRLHEWGWARLQLWARWIAAQPIWVRGLVGFATCAFVSAVVWATFKVVGLPAFLPENVSQMLRAYLHL